MKSLKELFADRRIKIVAISLGALLLLLAVWLLFAPKTQTSAQDGDEERLAQLLEMMEGVTDATVFLTQKEGETSAAVVMFRGEDSLSLRAQILNATALALDIPPKNVQVYPAK